MEGGQCCSLWKPWGKKSLMQVIHWVRALQGTFPEGDIVRRTSVLIQDELQHWMTHCSGQDVVAHSMGLEQCFALPRCGSSLGKGKAGAAPDALPGQRRDVVAGSMLQGHFSVGIQMESVIPSRSCLSTQLHKTMSQVDWHSASAFVSKLSWPRLISPKLGAGCASL